ncbi:hypothetical protein DFQ03_2844 [Maribacter caenipelagi]|uniref:Uncharacterized protein n=1 Tax=Maribacter caenipelagi TaxID=1447781 RepID=A0A4R7D0M6_9FLAO|nr:hypothetical protein [Maribacter caenipelagi]TDS13551.1 hypothetical protein DFQ03_2844 [Maribacter caenipelagi]
MNSFFQQNGFSIENIEIQLRQINGQIEYNKAKYPLDVEANLFFDWCLKRFDIIIGLVRFNPRFGWSEIQKEMDRLFRLDNGLTGFQLNLDFVDTDKPKRALIERNFLKL